MKKMANDDKLQQAQLVYKTLCKTFDDREWTYSKDDDNLAIITSVSGDDLPMPIGMFVESEKQLISLYSEMPFSVPEQARANMAIAICIINNSLADGCFDFDYFSGRICFRLTTSFRDSLISNELLDFMISFACYTVDTFNDKLLLIQKTTDLTPEQVAKFLGVKE